LDEAADRQRDFAAARSIIDGKRSTEDFDVFLCYNSAEKDVVMRIGESLKSIGLLPWLDEWELRPGIPWQSTLEQQIERIDSAAVFVGRRGIGPWQDLEQQAFLREFVKRSCPVIPVLLPGCSRTPKLPVFLKGMTWVDFRKATPDPFEQLVWGITGTRPGGLDRVTRSLLAGLSKELQREIRDTPRTKESKQQSSRQVKS
jgi:hypothetical protein